MDNSQYLMIMCRVQNSILLDESNVLYAPSSLFRRYLSRCNFGGTPAKTWRQSCRNRADVQALVMPEV